MITLMVMLDGWLSDAAPSLTGRVTGCRVAFGHIAVTRRVNEAVSE